MTALVQLGDVIDVASGQIDPREEPYCDMPHVGGDNIKSGTGELFNLRTARELNLISGKYVFGPDDVLYSKIRPALNKVALPDFEGICSADMYPLRPHPERMHRRFLAYLLRHDQFLSFAAKHSSRTNIPKLNRPALLSFEFRLPPLPEQRRIAEILDKADAIRRKRKEAIALTEDLLRSAFLEMVGPCAKTYDTWPEASFESLAVPEKGSMRTGPFGSDLKHSEFVDEGVAVLGIDNAVQNRFAWGERRFITQKKYERLTRYTVRPHDVIVTIMGTTGRSAVVPADIPLAITTKHLATITLNRDVAEPEFVAQAIHRHPAILAQIHQANRGAIMSGLNLGLIKSLVVRLPPIEIQRAFGAFTKRLRDSLENQEAARSESEDLFGSLVGRAFSGKLGAPGTGASTASTKARTAS
ncbi:MAG: restriction endonuclease subunit S [Proteobacteria bacterium]|nr:restriction endonuclease subunit S [Pseudomonadota bacterium]